MSRTVLFASGKGGTGRSTLCTLTARALCGLGRRVLIVEHAAGVRSVDILLGGAADMVYDLADVLCSRCEPAKAIYHTAAGPDLSPAPALPGAEYDQRDLMRLLRGLARHYDYLLLDPPASIGPTLGTLAAVADLAVLVLTPDPICVRAGRVMSDWLDERGLKNQRMVANRVATDRRGRLLAMRDLDEMMDLVGEGLLGVVPEEPSLWQYAAQGTEPEAERDAMRAIRNIAARLEGRFEELAVR